MKEILVGLLKSNNPLKLKQAIVDKFISSDKLVQPNCLFDLNDFLKEIEKIWHIDELIFETQTNDEIKSNYESLKQHYDLLKQILSFYNSKLDQINFDSKCFEFHLKNFFKSIFLTNPNRPNSNILITKNTTLLLITWLHLIIESFSDRIDFKFNLIEILSLINLKFSEKNNNQPPMINFYYFIQNDFKFCAEYLNLVKSFNFTDMISSNSELINTNYDPINNCIFEVICLLINSVTLKQNLHDQDQQSLIYQYEIGNQDIKELLSNLTQIVQLIKSFVNKSNRLFEWTLKYLIDILSDNSNELYSIQKLSNLNLYTAELFTCFDLNLAQMTINNYFYEASLSNSSIDDASLKNLLYSLIYLLNWPFENVIDEWICTLMTILATKIQKFKLLVSVCKETTDHILRLIQNRSTRVSALNVFCFFIINYQHSPSLFLKSCGKITEILAELKQKNNDLSINESQKIVDSKCYSQLVLLCYFCISSFGGYPEIYKPILDIIQNDIDLANVDSFRSKYLIDRNNSKFSKTENDFKSQNEIIIDDDLIVESKFRPNVTGLTNLGNTCYLNCIMQSLFACKKFVKNILEIDSTQMNIPEDSFLNQIQILFSIMHMTDRPTIKASNFVKHCTPSWFKVGQQQDSSEFLIFLLDNLKEQLKPYENSDFFSPHCQLINKTFGIHLKNECECSNCHTKTSTNDISFYLPLSFSHQSNESTDGKQSLQTLVDNFFHTEQLSTENGNPYSCSNCQSLQTAFKKIILTQDEKEHAPDYLIFTLNRFIYKQTSEGLQNVKIMEQLDYPMEISINSLFNGETVVEKYKIVSIVVHSGSSLHYGHYYSYITNKRTDLDLNAEQNEDKIEWLLANDSQITHASFDSLMSNLNLFKNDTPYVLFYKRVTPTRSLNSIRVTSKKLIDIIEQDNKMFEMEEKNRLLKKKNSGINEKFTNYFKDDDDDQNNGPRSSSGQPPSYCSNESKYNSGPRTIL